MPSARRSQLNLTRGMPSSRRGYPLLFARVLSAHHPNVLRPFRLRGPADQAVVPSAPLGSHAAPPARLQRVVSLRYRGRRRSGSTTLRSARVPLDVTRAISTSAESLRRAQCPIIWERVARTWAHCTQPPLAGQVWLLSRVYRPPPHSRSGLGQHGRSV